MTTRAQAGAGHTDVPEDLGPRRRIKAVVLDWAGTTQDFGSQAPVGAFMEVFAKYGVPITTAQARGPMGVYKLDHIRAIAAVPDRKSTRLNSSHANICYA